METECGATLELDELCVPFLPVDKKKKDFRRAGYFVAKIGSVLKDTELFTFGKEVTELRIPSKPGIDRLFENFLKIRLNMLIPEQS